jgi:phospholipid/cholesterol/gamma-HCH transport system permease protein
MSSVARSATGVFNGFFEWFGAWESSPGEFLRAAVTPPYEWRELIRQLDEVGSKSLPLVAMAGAAIGVVISLEARYSLTRFGAKSMFPATLVYSVIQVMGPIITGLVVSGRVGAGMGAELASMKVTEQIDAIEASAINPYRLLAATRIWPAS